MFQIRIAYLLGPTAVVLSGISNLHQGRGIITSLAVMPLAVCETKVILLLYNY
jgi:hypothetical protein